MRNHPSLSAALLSPLVAGLIAFVLPATAAHAQIAIDRETVLLNPTQAISRTADFVVQNDGPTTLQATVALADWDVDARGASRWQSPGRVTGSCGRRVSVSPKVLQLAPGARQTVHVAVSGSAQFDAECWSAAVVTSSTPTDGPQSAAVAAVASVPVYVTPTAVVSNGDLQNMFVVGDSLEVVYANTGNVRHDIVGQVQVRTTSDSVVMTLPMPNTTVLAGTTRRFRVARPALRPGSYVLFAIVDFGGAELTAVQAALEIRP
jgi:P pilus assembly chaperone PapD